jgi:hypothetical protein
MVSGTAKLLVVATCVCAWFVLGPAPSTFLFSDGRYDEAPTSFGSRTVNERARSSVSSSVALAAPAPPTPKPPPPVAPSKRRALIIGINRAAGSRPLAGAVADAKNLGRALGQYGFLETNVSMLLEGEATRSDILSKLDELAVKTPKDGVAVFALATHTRVHGGQNHLVAADGGLISATELAGRLAKVKSKMWVALPTCFAGGYALPGVVGDNRVATFASSAREESFELGTAGSYLFINMVRKAMIEGRAPSSVESAFNFAEAEIRRTAPRRVPLMSDGVKGDLVLGAYQKRRVVDLAASSPAPSSTPEYEPSPPDQAYAPQPTPVPRSRRGVKVCGRIRVNC